MSPVLGISIILGNSPLPPGALPPQGKITERNIRIVQLLDLENYPIQIANPFPFPCLALLPPVVTVAPAGFLAPACEVGVVSLLVLVLLLLRDSSLLWWRWWCPTASEREERPGEELLWEEEKDDDDDEDDFPGELVLFLECGCVVVIASSCSIWFHS